jgi:hypothetical protein
MDQAALLQGACRLGHANASNAKHEGQKLLREMEVVRPCPILGHQQPARKPRFNDVKARASRGLRELAHMNEDISIDAAPQRRALPHFAAERRGGHAQRRARSLHHRAYR